jgi:16S rRNA (adenine1518-N6/adenine1519-N6)-dimethyltransferase
VILRTVEELPEVGLWVAMVQREVGERFAAGPGSGAYGVPSVLAQLACEVRFLRRVPSSVFHPRPNVESALVRLQRRPEPAVPHVDSRRLFELVRAGFAQRRKMLRSSLAGLVTADAFAAAGIDEQARAEELDVEAWGRLAQ